MSAKIIPFPKTEKQLELEAMQDFVDKAKKVIMESTKKDFLRYDVPNIAGVPVKEPKSGKDFLEICKQFLEPEDYQDVLCGIMDREHYDALEYALQKVIDSYFTLEM
jgi:hypothetical protein